MPDPSTHPRETRNAVFPPNAPVQALCDRFIEWPSDPWAGTFCKLRAQHLGPCSPLYADERGQKP